MPSPRSPGPREPALPTLLFVERAARRERVSVEVDRPRAIHPRVTGFWRSGEFYRVLKIVETRVEYGELHVRAVTDRGSVDLRRSQRRDPRTMKTTIEWHLEGELDAFEISRPGT